MAPEGLRLDPELFRTLRYYGRISLDLLAGPLLGLALGRHLSQRFALSPLWMALGFLAGAGLSFFGVYRLMTTEIFRDWHKSGGKKEK